MPWNANKSECEIRTELVLRILEGNEPVSKLCEEYGVSRKTAYKWRNRYNAGQSLESQSRRPKNFPNATSQKVIDEIVDLRTKHRTLGGKKIEIMLKRKGLEGVPSGTTITSILRRHNLLDKQAVAEARPLKRYTKTYPNEMWQVDFKGHFPLGTGERCHPLTAIDDFSRFNLCCEPVLGESFEIIRPTFERMFREYGLPFSILCDNGNPWGGVGRHTAITAFETWLMELGILTLHGRPAHPQTQGKDERFNKTFKREVLNQNDFADLRTAKKICDEYRQFYNYERPHFAIGSKTPAEIFKCSERKYPNKIKEWEYPEGTMVRAVEHHGYIVIHHKHLYVSEGLRHKHIAMVPATKRNCVNFVFRNFLVARYNFSTKDFDFRKPYLLKGDPRPWAPQL